MELKFAPQLIFILLLAVASFAQSAPDSASMPGMNMGHDMMDMSTNGGAFQSGTSWEPASTTHHMWMTSLGSWTFMAHGNLIAGYDAQGGPRGVGKAMATNWLMMMEDHKLGAALIEFRQMLSAEPLTTPRPGFPELFQTGETYRGRPLVDHQHPHDVFGELAMRVTYPVTERASFFFYGGPVGEPALGPVGFLHRLSAGENPAAPLTHHLQDSTHISFGVVTGGAIFGPVKIEASAFNGREPDEKRYNFDFNPMTSWSTRLSVAPTRNWVVQYSYGHLEHPEALEPGNTERQTASVSYHRSFNSGYWANTLVWGRNNKLTGITNGYLYESSLNFAQKNYAFGRIELVDKDELELPVPLAGNNFRIGAYTIGGVRDLVQNRYGQVGLGTSLTFYSKPSVLDSIYGEHPVSVEVFLRFRPPVMEHHHH